MITTLVCSSCVPKNIDPLKFSERIISNGDISESKNVIGTRRCNQNHVLHVTVIEEKNILSDSFAH